MYTRRVRRALPVLLVLLAAACEAAPPPIPPPGESCEHETLLAPAPDHDVDLLFVIDDSPLMGSYQQALALNLAQMGAVLESFQGRLNLHIGVVAADPAGAGRLVAPAACGVSGNFGSDGRAPGTDERHSNHAGSLGDALACLGTLGAGGAPTAAPLAVLRQALSGHVSENAGFR